MKPGISTLFSSICLIVFSFLFAHNASAAALYLSQLVSPGSLGTAGVANVVNNVGTDSALTNPAGMTGVQGDSVLGGLQLSIPSVRFDSSIAEAGGSDGGHAAFVSAIPGFYVVKPLSEKTRLGFSSTGLLGGGVDYGSDFVGRYQATRAVLSGMGLSPSIGYKINDKVSVGAGVSFIYTIMDMDVAINQSTFGLPDGAVHINKIDDWGTQGFLGVTWQVTDKALLGFVYRTESEVELEGDLDIDVGIPGSIINLVTSKADEIGVDFNYAQAFTMGLSYKLTDRLTMMMDVNFEDWSAFSDNFMSIQGGALTTTIERGWEDTWHVGAAIAYRIGDDQFITTGLGYDSSPVSDADRTADLPMDEQVKFGMSYGKIGKGNLDYAFGFSYIWLGTGTIDQTAQGVRFKGEFDTNSLVFVGANLRYRF
jgi:long-chain fatty acid transport protein